ncbi:hypothetical protein ACJX0J_037466 [Zea mays]
MNNINITLAWDPKLPVTIHNHAEDIWLLRHFNKGRAISQQLRVAARNDELLGAYSRAEDDKRLNRVFDVIEQIAEAQHYARDMQYPQGSLLISFLLALGNLRSEKKLAKMNENFEAEAFDEILSDHGDFCAFLSCCLLNSCMLETVNACVICIQSSHYSIGKNKNREISKDKAEELEKPIDESIAPDCAKGFEIHIFSSFPFKNIDKYIFLIFLKIHNNYTKNIYH